MRCQYTVIANAGPATNGEHTNYVILVHTKYTNKYQY